MNITEEVFEEKLSKKKVTRVQRACFNCRKRKQGCDEERPCKRCTEKGIECIEGEHKQKKPRTKPKLEIPIEYEENVIEPQNEESDGKSAFSDIQPGSKGTDQIPVQHEEIDSDTEMEETRNEEKQTVPSIAPIFPFLDDQPIQRMDMDFDFDNMEIEDDTKDFVEDYWNRCMSNIYQEEDLCRQLKPARDYWAQILESLRSPNSQRLQGLLQGMDDLKSDFILNAPATLFWSSCGRIHHANPSFCKMTSYSVEELRQSKLENLVGKGAHGLFKDEDLTYILKKQLQAVSSSVNRPFSMDVSLISKQNREIVVTCSMTNIRESPGRTFLTVCHFFPKSR